MFNSTGYTEFASEMNSRSKDFSQHCTWFDRRKNFPKHMTTNWFTYETFAEQRTTAPSKICKKVKLCVFHCLITMHTDMFGCITKQRIINHYFYPANLWTPVIKPLLIHILSHRHVYIQCNTLSMCIYLDPFF